MEKGLARRRTARPARSPDVPISAIPVPADADGVDGADGADGVDGSSGAEQPAARLETRLRYLPGLDGLRAISVLAVLAYHYRPNYSLLRGGFLGVEVFFVISGYLITSLLLTERRRQARVDLRAFWLRRARRLAPALFALILCTGFFILIRHHSELHANRGDLLFGFWAENWWTILHHAIYGEIGARQPLQHLWSLAVEEQFYLLWPLAFIAGMFALGRKRMPWAVAALAAGSWLVGIVWMHASTQSAADLNNALYMSTFTRAYGLLLGALAAFLLGPERFRGKPAPTAPRALNLIGAGALVVLAIQMRFQTLGGHSLYYFGLLLADALTVALIVAVVHPASSWNRLLGTRPLREIGVRSYGIYLWGVVVLEFTRPGIDLHWSAPALFLYRLVLIAVLVELSYRFVEQPVRRGAVGRLIRSTRDAVGNHRRVLVRRWQAAGALLGVLLLTLTGFALASSPSNAIDNGQRATGGGDKLLHTHGTLPPVRGTTPHVIPSTRTTAPRPGSRSTVPHTAQFTGFPTVWSRGYIVTAVGDSVMLGANLGNNPLLEGTLRTIVGAGVWVNALEGRQASLCADYIQLLESNHQLGAVLIVHCGNNGAISNHFVADVMRIAGPKRHVVFMTDKVERPYELANNQLIVTQTKRYPNAKVLDWYYFGTHIDQDTYFYPQENGGLRLHLTPAGARFYTNLVVNTLRNWGWLPPTAPH